MKKLAFVIVALAIVLGFLSCKKETVDVKEPLVFSISADIDDDSKAIVTPLGIIEFNNGDHLYPAYKGLNNKSSLIHNTGTCFSGSISLNNEVYDDKTDKGRVPFHFFCLAGVNDGGSTTAYWTEVGLSEGCTSTSTCISLQNQGKDKYGTWNDKRRDMPLLCFGQSRENFEGEGTTSFTVDMKNKCALVKYVVEAGIDYGTEIFIVGLNNVVEVDFKVPYYKYMSGKDNQMQVKLNESLDKGYDDDGFKFSKRVGTIQNACLHTPRSQSKMLDIIIPYRNKPENETDKTYCYSLLLPQTKGLDKLSGYYYDNGENQIPLTVAIYDRDDKPAQEIKENKFYKIIVNKASQGNQ